MAAEHNLVEAVECLLKYGADPTAVDKVSCISSYPAHTQSVPIYNVYLN